MRDKSHMEQVERWAEYCRNNPDWKKHQKPFIDSQIIIANKFYEKLAETPEGREKIKMLRRIK